MGPEAVSLPGGSAGLRSATFGPRLPADAASPVTFLRSTHAADAGSALVTGGGVMSEMLMKGLTSTKRELEAGVADAEAELARTEEYCRKLEEMIAVGKATLHAA